MNSFARLMAVWVDGRPLEVVAAKLGKSPSTVHNWLTGKSSPPRTAIAGIVEVTGLQSEQVCRAIKADRRASHAPRRTKAGAA